LIWPPVDKEVVTDAYARPTQSEKPRRQLSRYPPKKRKNSNRNPWPSRAFCAETDVVLAGNQPAARRPGTCNPYRPHRGESASLQNVPLRECCPPWWKFSLGHAVGVNPLPIRAEQAQAVQLDPSQSGDRFHVSQSWGRSWPRPLGEVVTLFPHCKNTN